MSIEDAFLPAEREHRDRVYAATFGHLAPLKNTTYRGYIVFALGIYQGPVCVLDVNMRTADGLHMNDSPWWYDALHDVLLDIAHVDRHPRQLPAFIHFAPGLTYVEPGCVYEFQATFRNYRFSGSVDQVM